jgi:hypothetical protein
MPFILMFNVGRRRRKTFEGNYFVPVLRRKKSDYGVYSILVSTKNTYMKSMLYNMEISVATQNLL